jgi:hypothetical protein
MEIPFDEEPPVVMDDRPPELPQTVVIHHAVEQPSPFLRFLVARKDTMKHVLDFCSFEKMLVLQAVAARHEELLPLFQLCECESLRLAEDMMQAAIWNDLAHVNLLLDRKVSPSLVLGHGLRGFLTPLAGASMRGNHAIVARLLKAGADVNWADEQGTTALEMAKVRLRYMSQISALDEGASLTQTIRLLLLHGGRILAKDEL